MFPLSPSKQSYVCPKCGNSMEEGFISTAKLVGGVYWYKGEWGTKGTALKAYKCPKCGFIEIYQRYQHS